MSVYQVNKMLRDVNCNPTLAQRYRVELDTVLQQYELTTEERTAIKDGKLRTLYDMGVNPLLLLVSSLAAGTEMGTYMAAMNPQR